ncbi:protein of unknown function (plasmid) [Cupriavidus neocaledonicus]|uniref:Uncharacterized protein n=1 Tax=Cupriavidus neocaledonicus TaxID=1040979 RepID=A0A375HQ66_9BURK|nr:hypothetical protein CBM2605_B160067 [Cupriavidus neocaledonicus]SPD58910.1 protein of unknown function [Cupriavidus neocaledonicus]
MPRASAVGNHSSHAAGACAGRLVPSHGLVRPCGALLGMPGARAGTAPVRRSGNQQREEERRR